MKASNPFPALLRAFFQEWLAEQRSLWEKRLDQFDAYALKLKEQQK